jgi:MFS transporter, DHA1 family, inner membrane transport protein
MGNPWIAIVNVLFIGGGFAVVPGVQTRLMDVAGEAQTLAAALSHSAFNLANALGAWLGGVSIAAGYGWTSTGLVGAVLGLRVWLQNLRRNDRLYRKKAGGS